MSVKLLTEHHLEFLSLKGASTGSSESTLIKIPHCWKSHVVAPYSVPLESIVSVGLVSLVKNTMLSIYLERPSAASSC